MRKRDSTIQRIIRTQEVIQYWILKGKNLDTLKRWLGLKFYNGNGK